MKIVNIEVSPAKTYKCFSPNLYNKIVANDIFPINTYIHKNGKTVAVFILEDNLSKLLTEWTKNKPKGSGEKWKKKF